MGPTLSASTLRRRAGMLSGPDALCGSNFFRSLITPLTDTWIPGIWGKGLGPSSGKLLGSSSLLNTEQNWLLSIFALSLLPV